MLRLHRQQICSLVLLYPALLLIALSCSALSSFHSYYIHTCPATYNNALVRTLYGDIHDARPLSRTLTRRDHVQPFTCFVVQIPSQSPETQIPNPKSQVPIQNHTSIPAEPPKSPRGMPTCYPSQSFLLRKLTRPSVPLASSQPWDRLPHGTLTYTDRTVYPRHSL